LLLRDKVFESFAKRGSFDLVVGMDAVTNTRAIAALDVAQQEIGSLNVRIFVTERNEPMFHPKCSWFTNQDGGVIVAGSGNLTEAGLRGNWEAYVLSRISAQEMESVRDQWATWLETNANSLREVTDPVVLERAAANDRVVGTLRPGRRYARGTATTRDLATSDKVLVAELSRSGERWSQVNFDLDNYEKYFGARRGTQRRVLFRHVAKDGSLQDVESRPSVEVASQNYRFELDAARGLRYPDRGTGRPIAVFLKVLPRSFVYRLLMPGDEGYQEAEGYLKRTWVGRGDRMRRVRTSLKDLGDLRVAKVLERAANRMLNSDEVTAGI